MSGSINFPYRFIHDLPPRAQRELWENFQKLAAQFPVAPTVFDVYVDPTLSADQPASRTFQTPFKAIAYAVDTLGLSVVTVGWRNFGTSRTATETASYGGVGTATWVTVKPVGEAATNLTGRGNTAMPTWALAGNTDNGKIPGLSLFGINLTVTTNRSTAPIGATQMFAKDSVISGTTGSTTLGFALPSGYYENTQFTQCTFINDAGGHMLMNCMWESQSLQTVTIGSLDKFYAYNSRFHSGSGALCTWTASDTVFIAAECAWVGDNPSGSTIALTYGGSAFFYISSPANLGFGFASGSHLALTISSGATEAAVYGSYKTITVSGAVNSLIINAQTSGVFDITGPGQVTISSQVGGHTLRGTGINAALSMVLTSGTGLSLVGVTQAVITAAFRTSSTAKAYAIDVASGNGVMIEEGDSGGSTASTNASTTFLVINHLGTSPSGSAGPWFAGTYPSPRWGPDFTESFVQQLPLDAVKLRHITIKPGTPGSGQVLSYNATTKMLEWVTNSAVDATAVHTGDSAGPWMAGTYPSPRTGPDFTMVFLLGK